MNNFYVYVFLDPRKPGKYVYDNLYFEFEPFYVGKGINERIVTSKYDKLNRFKTNKIKKIELEKLKVISYKLFENLSEKESLEIEKDLIKKIGKMINENGPLVNFSDGGTGGDNISKHPYKSEIVKKMSESKKGEKNSFYGKHHTDETKQKLSTIMVDITLGEKNGFYGKKHTENTKKKHSDLMKGRYTGETNPFYGKKHSEESKLRMSELAKKRKHNENSKLKISESLKGKRVGINNPSATKYIIQTPQGEILEFIGIKELDDKLRGVNPRRIIKQKEHKGYKVIDIVKLYIKKR